MSIRKRVRQFLVDFSMILSTMFASLFIWLAFVAWMRGGNVTLYFNNFGEGFLEFLAFIGILLITLLGNKIYWRE